MGEVGVGQNNRWTPGHVMSLLVSNLSISIFLTISFQLLTNVGRRWMRRTSTSLEVINGGIRGRQRQQIGPRICCVLSPLFILSCLINTILGSIETYIPYFLVWVGIQFR